MLPDTLLEQINQLAEAYAKAQTCRALAHAAHLEVAHLDLAREHLRARAAYWDAQVTDQRARLTVALHSALPPTIYAAPDPLACVHRPNDREVEVRGSIDRGSRAVSIRFTGIQAVAVGAAMIACAAVGTEQTGGLLAEILPPIPLYPPGPTVPPA